MTVADDGIAASEIESSTEFRHNNNKTEVATWYPTLNLASAVLKLPSSVNIKSTPRAIPIAPRAPNLMLSCKTLPPHPITSLHNELSWIGVGA